MLRGWVGMGTKGHGDCWRWGRFLVNKQERFGDGDHGYGDGWGWGLNVIPMQASTLYINRCRHQLNRVQIRTVSITQRAYNTFHCHCGLLRVAINKN